MYDRDNIETILRLSNGDSVDLIITRSKKSNVTDEDFELIINNVYLEKLVYCDSIDLSFYKNEFTKIQIQEKIILAGLPGIKVLIGNYIETEEL